MLAMNQDDTRIDLVQHEDGVLDNWIASLSPDGFQLLLERLDDLQDGVDVLSWLAGSSTEVGG
jgi:hypothetical protein